jgi:hypothetical protein
MSTPVKSQPETSTAPPVCHLHGSAEIAGVALPTSKLIETTAEMMLIFEVFFIIDLSFP